MADIWFYRLTAIAIFAAEVFVPSLTESQRVSGWIMATMMLCTVSILSAIAKAKGE